MSELVAQPWKRYGHHRIYFKTHRGETVGWFDCIAEEAHLEDEAHAADFSAAVSRLVPSPAHGDLARNRPGERAAAVERGLRRAAPVRSIIARLCAADTDEKHWRLGRQGEQAVAARLARLSRQWHVLHAVEVGVGGSDIDHLVIGPGGVYTVNAKHHPDASVWVGGECVLISGHAKPYIRNSRHEAQRAARLLTRHTGFPVPVVGLIAVVGARGGFAVKAQPSDGLVHVVTRKQIHQWLRRRATMLDAGQISAIYDVARQPHIWLG